MTNQHELLRTENMLWFCKKLFITVISVEMKWTDYDRLVCERFTHYVLDALRIMRLLPVTSLYTLLGSHEALGVEGAEDEWIHNADWQQKLNFTVVHSIEDHNYLRHIMQSPCYSQRWHRKLSCQSCFMTVQSVLHACYDAHCNNDSAPMW